MRQNGKFSSEKKETFLPKLICASSDESADILYASGFHAPDEFLYFETAERRGIVVSPLEYSRACAEAKKGVEVIDRSALMRECGPDKPFLPFFSRHLGVSRWCVPERFPLKTAIELSEAGIEVICAKAPFFPARECKTRVEIAAIAKSVRATEEMMKLLHAMLAESKVNAQGCLELAGKVLTCEGLRAEIEGNFKRMGYTASRTIIACGVQSAAPHNIGSGPVRVGEVLVADIFPRSDATGYWGDMTRTFLKGRAPKHILRAYRAVQKASEVALGMIRAGVIASRLSRGAEGFRSRARHDPCGRHRLRSSCRGGEDDGGARIPDRAEARRNALRLHSRSRTRRRAGNSRRAARFTAQPASPPQGKCRQRRTRALRSGLGRNPPGGSGCCDRNGVPELQHDGKGA